MQPWVGERSDRTWNRFGRRKGWILLGMPIAAVAFVFIPLAQSILAIAVFILITNFGMALFRSPAVAWLGDLFPIKDRSKANGVINLMGGPGGLLVSMMGAQYRWLFVFSLVFMALAWITMLRVRTRQSAPTVSPMASLGSED